MFSLDALQNRWLILALVGGVALVLALALFYLMLWKPRSRAGPDEAGAPAEDDVTGRGAPREPSAAVPTDPGVETPHQPVPWILILTYVGIATYAAIYVFARALRPPNW